VASTYRSWAATPRDERWLAHAGYLAALEREEHVTRRPDAIPMPNWARSSSVTKAAHRTLGMRPPGSGPLVVGAVPGRRAAFVCADA
jgi:hypothetical protein